MGQYMGYDIQSITSRARHQIGEHIDVHSKKPLNLFGLVQGLVGRERIQTHISDKAHVPTEQGRALNEVLQLGSDLALSYVGIHPSVLSLMSQMTDEPHDPFWEKPLFEIPKPSKLRVIKTELDIPAEDIDRQVGLITGLLPQGNLDTVFFSKGDKSIWRGIPIAREFSTNPHQMSVPANTNVLFNGFNLLLLTTQPSVTVPKEWSAEFPLKTSSKNPTLDWMNLHQVGHCLALPTCWEYVDRTMSLVTPNELLKLTSLRLTNLKRWFDDYMDGNFVPDSTSYLYEVKIMQRALWVAKQMGLENKRWLPEELPWFRGLHFEEILSQMQTEDAGQAIAGLTLMDQYLKQHRNSQPNDAILNSAVFSTDYGTHPIEEVVVDVLAKGTVGLLDADKGKNDYSYWIPYYKEVVTHWQKLDPHYLKD